MFSFCKRSRIQSVDVVPIEREVAPNEVKLLFSESIERLLDDAGKELIRVADGLGSILHGEWLAATRDKYEKDGRSRLEVRLRPTVDGFKNLNVEWESLHADHKKENINAAFSAIDAFLNFPSDEGIHSAASMVHDEWMLRNPKATHNENLHYNYFILDDSEQEKDRVQVLRARDHIKKLIGTTDPIRSDNIHRVLKIALTMVKPTYVNKI